MPSYRIKKLPASVERTGFRFYYICTQCFLYYTDWDGATGMFYLLEQCVVVCVCIRHAVDCSWVGFSGFLLCDVTGIGETDTALRAETAEGTNRWRSRLQESRCWTRSPLVEMTGWVVSLYISILSRQTKKIHNLCSCKALRGVSVHLADDEAWI